MTILNTEVDENIVAQFIEKHPQPWGHLVELDVETRIPRLYIVDKNDHYLFEVVDVNGQLSGAELFCIMEA